MNKIKYDPYKDFKKTVYPNGLTTYFSEVNRPWFFVQFIVHAGSREDLPQKQGLAHFVEHLVSDSVPGMTSTTVRQYFESVGGWANLGGTSYLATKYSFFIPADKEILEKSLKLFETMMLNAKLGTNLERERNVILREFHQYYPIRQQLEWDLEPYKYLFKNHRFATYSQPLGWPEDISTITLEDLQDFYNKYYVPANITIIASGGLSKEVFKSFLNNTGFIKNDAGKKNSIPKPLPVKDYEGKKFSFSLSDFLKEKVDKADSSIIWKVPAELAFTDYQKARLLRNVLSELLDDEIRQKRGWSYSPSSSFGFYQDIATFSVNGTLAVDTAKELPEIVYNCIKSLKGQQELFNHEKNSTLNSFLTYDELGVSVAKNVSNDIISGSEVRTLSKIYSEIEKTVLEDCIDLAKYLDPSRAVEVVINP